MKEVHLTTKRDYGTLAKAAPRLLTPIAEPLGFRQLMGASYTRSRGDWIDCFFLQSSVYGSGDFCVNLGVWVPKLDGLRQNEPTDRNLSLVVSERLTPLGAGGDHWFEAANLVGLKSSIETVGQGLRLAETWFSRVNSLADVASLYRATNTVSKKVDSAHSHVLANTTYGFLLLLAGDAAEARDWLSFALSQHEAIVAEEEATFARRKPGKQALAFYEIHVRQRNAVRAALRE